MVRRRGDDLGKVPREGLHFTVHESKWKFIHSYKGFFAIHVLEFIVSKTKSCWIYFYRLCFYWATTPGGHPAFLSLCSCSSFSVSGPLAWWWRERGRRHRRSARPTPGQASRTLSPGGRYFHNQEQWQPTYKRDETFCWHSGRLRRKTESQLGTTDGTNSERTLARSAGPTWNLFCWCAAPNVVLDLMDISLRSCMGRD